MNAVTHEPHRCKARSSQTGEPCKRWANHGAVVCPSHGARAPQVKARAEDRIRDMVDPALNRLLALLNHSQGSVAYAAVKDILDRAGLKQPDRQQISGPDGGPIQTEDISRLTDDERAERIQMIVHRIAARNGSSAGNGNNV